MARCAECGVELPEGTECKDLFYALLALESQIPGGPTSVAHFRAVAAYGLQNPRGMNYTVEAYEGLREALADELAGRSTLAEIRQRVRKSAAGAGRVTRRAGDPEIVQLVCEWPVTVADVVSVEPEAGPYDAAVEQWARSVIGCLCGE